MGFLKKVEAMGVPLTHAELRKELSELRRATSEILHAIRTKDESKLEDAAEKTNNFAHALLDAVIERGIKG